jgi:hypothetical protein
MENKQVFYMKRIRFTTATIKRINQKGIEYLDDEGKLNYIDFAACKNIDPKQKYVAFRDISGFTDDENKPYIEFYSEPQVTFEFEASDAGRNDFENFYFQIHQLGWYTFDLS